MRRTVTEGYRWTDRSVKTPEWVFVSLLVGSKVPKIYCAFHTPHALSGFGVVRSIRKVVISAPLGPNLLLRVSVNDTPMNSLRIDPFQPLTPSSKL